MQAVPTDGIHRPAFAAPHCTSPRAKAVRASHGSDLQAHAGYRRWPGPVSGLSERVWEHDMAADDAGLVPVAVVDDRLGVGLQVETRANQVSCAFPRQTFQAGPCVMGVEPSTHHMPGNGFARDRGEMIWLKEGRERRLDSRFAMQVGVGAIAAAAARIGVIVRPPEDDYPVPTGRFGPLQGAADQERAWT